MREFIKVQIHIILLLSLFWASAFAEPTKEKNFHSVESSSSDSTSNNCIDCESQSEALSAARKEVSIELDQVRKTKELELPVDRMNPVIHGGINSRIFRLVESLLCQNLSQFYVIHNNNRHTFINNPASMSETTRPNCNVIRIRLVADHPHYPHFSANLKFSTQDGKNQFEDVLEFRSNSYAAFLDYGYKISARTKKQQFFMTYINSKGQVAAHDQTSTVVADLPTSVILSRTMADQEYEHWKTGDIQNIEQHFAYTTYGDGRLRTFFALNQYEYHKSDSKMSLATKIPKAVLSNLYKSGHLVINLYQDSINAVEDGMPPEARTSFGLEVEVIVLDEEGRKELLPYMQNPVSTVKH